MRRHKNDGCGAKKIIKQEGRIPAESGELLTKLFNVDRALTLESNLCATTLTNALGYAALAQKSNGMKKKINRSRKQQKMNIITAK